MGRAKRILVVDDDEVILKSLENILKTEGYHVDTATTGREAIGKSEMEFHDLALLDIKLPDMEGTELLTRLHKEVPAMMKIMVTGHASLGNAVNSLNLGADAYLMKPIAPKKILQVVREKLLEREEAKEISEEKVKTWIETRVRELRLGER